MFKRENCCYFPPLLYCHKKLIPHSILISKTAKKKKKKRNSHFGSDSCIKCFLNKRDRKRGKEPQPCLSPKSFCPKRMPQSGEVGGSKSAWHRRLPWGSSGVSLFLGLATEIKTLLSSRRGRSPCLPGLGRAGLLWERWQRAEPRDGEWGPAGLGWEAEGYWGGKRLQEIALPVTPPSSCSDAGGISHVQRNWLKPQRQALPW